MWHTLMRKERTLFFIRVVKALAIVVAVMPPLLEVSVRAYPTVVKSLEFTAIFADGASRVTPPCATITPMLVKQEFPDLLWGLVLDFFLQSQGFTSRIG